MAVEYAKVLNDLKVEYTVIGRSDSRCESFYRITGKIPLSGGLENYLKSKPETPDAVINTTGIESLTESTSLLLNYGVKYILLEKPGFGNPKELELTKRSVDLNRAEVLIAYNRRFYSSVIRAKEIIQNDGGIKSFNFDFTEWAHIIKDLKKENVELENWFYGNSLHLIDLAFFLGGKPIELTSFQKGGLDWHPSGEIFSGAGITESGALFSYIANWSSPGRWGLELCTNNFRLIFKPIEKLSVMKLGSVKIEEDDLINYNLDELFKPGLYLQTQAFLKKELSQFATVNDQIIANNTYLNKINSK